MCAIRAVIVDEHLASTSPHLHLSKHESHALRGKSENALRQMMFCRWGMMTLMESASKQRLMYFSTSAQGQSLGRPRYRFAKSAVIHFLCLFCEGRIYEEKKKNTGEEQRLPTDIHSSVITTATTCFLVFKKYKYDRKRSEVKDDPHQHECEGGAVWWSEGTGWEPLSWRVGDCLII